MRVTEEGFIHVPITKQMVNSASTKANALGPLRNSIRKGKGNLVGFLGEEICLDVFIGAESTNTYQHDFRLGGATWEVKSKDRTVAPCSAYDASVADFNACQKTDFYIFTSILRHKPSGEYTDGYITGYMPPREYKGLATFFNKGDIDPSNGWQVSADCYNVPYSKLHSFRSLFGK